jgi:regulator of RNase E activity RraA
MSGEGDAPGSWEPFDSSDVSDACDRLGVAAARTGALRPLWPDCPPVAGRLVTVRLEPAATTGSPLAELLDVLAGASEAVVFVDLGGRVDTQAWGAVLATAASRFGARGALVNGAARDVAGLRELGFPTYARGVHPGQMRGRLRVTGVDVPVELDGAVVEPGSMGVADAGGAVFLPAAAAGDVLALAAELRRQEDEQLRAAGEGADPRTVLGGGSQARHP